MISRILRSIPLGFGALVLGVSSALLFANLALGALHHGDMKFFPALTGVMRVDKAGWTLRNVLDGSAQASFARRIGLRMPLYPAAVRLRNQVEYSGFGIAAASGLIAGNGNMVFEQAYSREYCTRNVAAWRPFAEAWARDIRRMQDFTEHRGRAFVYTLTPSKVAQYPDIIPHGYHCPAPAADRADLVPAWTAILRDAGVHVADGVTALSVGHGRYPFRLYPTGGTHWNDVGAALAEQAVFAALDRQRPDAGFAPFQFTWTMQRHPSRRDTDIAHLMNLFVPAGDDPSPVVNLQFPAAPAVCTPRSIVIVGGSFSHETGDFLSRSPCHPDVTEYEYWHSFRLTWRDGDISVSNTVDPAIRDRAVMDADVLIYEENEELLSEPHHGQALFAFLQSQGA